MKKTVLSFAEAKASGRKISVVAAYDYATAKLADEAGVDAVLVGDTLATAVLGYENSTKVTMEDMIHHGSAVVRGVENALVIVDMPFMSFQVSPEKALENAGRIISETGAAAVKLEGGDEIAPTIEKIVKAGIPVCAHIGMTPQSVNRYGGHKVQGEDADSAQLILQDAKAVEDAGAFAVVLECVPAPLAAFITEHLSVPTIGIGAGLECDGQAQTCVDMLGIARGPRPSYAGAFASLGDAMVAAFRDYVAAVESGAFPRPENAFAMDEEVADSLVWRAEELGGLTEFEFDNDWNELD